MAFMVNLNRLNESKEPNLRFMIGVEFPIDTGDVAVETKLEQNIITC
jgi:hypothetical protein